MYVILMEKSKSWSIHPNKKSESNQSVSSSKEEKNQVIMVRVLIIWKYPALIPHSITALLAEIL